MHLLHPSSCSPRNDQKWHSLVAFHYLPYCYEVGVLEQTCHCFLRHLKHPWVIYVETLLFLQSSSCIDHSG